MDNYFNGIYLTERLLNAGVHVVGTIKLNRKKIPKTFSHFVLKKGETLGI